MALPFLQSSFISIPKSPTPCRSSWTSELDLASVDIRFVSVGENELRLRHNFLLDELDDPLYTPIPVRAHYGEREKRFVADLTGLKIWPTSLPMLERMSDLLLTQKIERSPDEARPFRILELGAGCGLLGIGLAATDEDFEVVLTDRAVDVEMSSCKGRSVDTLTRLRDNVELNRAVVGGRATVERLVWGNELDMDLITNLAGRAPFDAVIGSDLFYDPSAFPALVRTMKRLAVLSEGKNTLPIFLGYLPRNLGEAQFFDAAMADGFRVRTERIGERGEAVLAEFMYRDFEHEQRDEDTLWDMTYRY